MNSANTKNKSKVKIFAAVIDFMKSYPTVPIILVALIGFSFVPYFLTAGNMKTIMAANAVILIAAVGQTLVILTGGIDLSVSTIISAAAVVSATIMVAAESIFVGVVVALLVGLAFGAINGVLVGYFGLTPFITTMGTQLAARGIAFVLSQGIAVKGTPMELIEFGFGKVLGIPNIMIVAIFVCIICSVLLTRTTWGRDVILFGSNKSSAKYCGINTRFVEMSVYTISGLLAGIAGFMSIANLGNAIPGVGDTLLLIIIGGVVLGGTSMNGGEGSVIRTILGVGLLAILTSGLNMVGIPFYDQLIVQGFLIFLGNGISVKFSSTRG